MMFPGKLFFHFTYPLRRVEHEIRVKISSTKALLKPKTIKVIRYSVCLLSCIVETFYCIDF